MKFILVLALIVSVSGCVYLRKVTSPDDENLLSGSGSIIEQSSENDFHTLNLDDLLKDYGLQDVDDVSKKATSDEYKYRRNDFQERLISVSNQKCSAYLRTIVSSKSKTSTGWTSLSLLLSGAASVVSHGATASALSAGSTVSTGFLSTYNEAYFNSLTITVITSGIEAKRAGLLSSIQRSQAKKLSDYSVNAAVSDAIAYHSA